MLVASAAILGSLPLTAGFASGAEGDAQDLPPVDPAALEAAVADQQQESEQRQTPEAHQAREESATAFASQSPSDAVATAQDEHPEIVEQPAWRSLTPQQADQVEQYYGEFGARVDIPGEPSDGMVESTLPLRAETDSGAMAPVNLSLTDQGDTLEPTRPLVETAIPNEVGDGVALESGIGFAPDTSAAGANASAHVVQDTAVYPNVREDSDFLARPTPTGAEALIQVRSEASPESFGLDFDLPAGAHLEQGGELGGPRIVQGEEELAEVTAPLAWDAEGWTVDVSYHLDGDEMVIEVPHRDQDVAYPLLIDPAVVDDQASFASSDHVGWQSAVSPANSPRIQNDYVNGNLRTQGGPGTYTAGEWGGWHFDAPGSESVIYGGAFSNLAVTQSNSAVTQGLWAPSSNAWDQGTTNNSLFPNSPFTKTTNVFTTAQIRHCLGPTFCIGGTGGNQLWTRMSSTSANHSGTFTMLTGGATMWIADFTPPVQGDPEQATNGQPDLPEWIKGDETLSSVVKGQDHGLGVKTFKTTATPPSGQPLEATRTHECWGNRWYRCPHGDDFFPSNEVGVSGDSFTYPAALFPEGTTTLQSKVADYAGNWSQDRTWQVKVDHSDPTLSISGPLKDAAEQNEPLTEPSYDLSAHATDQYSGVTDVRLKVDDELIESTQEECPDEECPPPSEGNHEVNETLTLLPTEDIESGNHTVKVVVEDAVGRTTESSPFEIHVPDPNAPQVPDTLDCTGPDELTNFGTYSLGHEFDQFDVTSTQRRCDEPVAGEPVRANYVSHLYDVQGGCEPPTNPAAGGCAAPLEIQTWPACERSLADYELDVGVAYPSTPQGTVSSGALRYSFDGGTRVEIYTGAATIVIMGTDPDQVADAVASVRRDSDMLPPHNPTENELGSGDLGPPVAGATTGELPCGDDDVGPPPQLSTEPVAPPAAPYTQGGTDCQGSVRAPVSVFFEDQIDASDVADETSWSQAAQDEQNLDLAPGAVPACTSSDATLTSEPSSSGAEYEAQVWSSPNNAATIATPDAADSASGASGENPPESRFDEARRALADAVPAPPTNLYWGNTRTFKQSGASGPTKSASSGVVAKVALCVTFPTGPRHINAVVNGHAKMLCFGSLLNMSISVCLEKRVTAVPHWRVVGVCWGDGRSGPGEVHASPAYHCPERRDARYRTEAHSGATFAHKGPFHHSYSSVHRTLGRNCHLHH